MVQGAQTGLCLNRPSVTRSNIQRTGTDKRVQRGGLVSVRAHHAVVLGAHVGLDSLSVAVKH